uniref:Uncharacterized protein n=1 Tax=Amphiprion ocellaris TaxID=80972 RepID=A0A3Q1C7D5_AMPOC
FCCDFTYFCCDFELKTFFYVDLSVRLDRKWLLWHNFMKEHAHLDAWLRLAEQAVASPSPAHFTYSTAKEELRRFERLQREAGSQLVQLDSLTRRNRTLTRMFDGVMRTRLLSSAGECGRRWDNVNQKLESITAGLKLFVSEWEEFEAQGAELALWLADMDVRLSEVDHLTGSTCEKLRQLQVCVIVCNVVHCCVVLPAVCIIVVQRCVLLCSPSSSVCVCVTLCIVV